MNESGSKIIFIKTPTKLLTTQIMIKIKLTATLKLPNNPLTSKINEAQFNVSEVIVQLFLFILLHVTFKKQKYMLNTE